MSRIGIGIGIPVHHSREGGLAVQLPPVIAGLFALYDAEVGVSEDVDGVNRWIDQIGSNDLIQATGSKKPQLDGNGLATGRVAVVFDGVDDNLDAALFSLPGSGDSTIFIVAKVDIMGTFTAIDGLTGIDKLQVFAPNDTTVMDLFQGGTNAKSGVADNLVPFVATGVKSLVAASDFMRLNNQQGASVDVGSQTLTAGMRAGANNLLAQFWNGPISEILFYDRELTTQEIADVEHFLFVKWEILDRRITQAGDDRITSTGDRRAIPPQ